MVGKTYNQLKVIEQADDYVSPNRNKVTQWVCKCLSCGKLVVVRGNYLRSGHTKSCKACGSLRAGLKSRKPSAIFIENNIAHVVGTKGEEFLIDVDDIPIVQGYCWRSNELGYAVTDINGKTIRMHRLILNLLKSKMKVDHKSGIVSDNRKANLRIVTQQLNSYNKRKSSLNTSGMTGVSWDKSRNKWQVHIGVEKRYILIGRFESYEDACAARLSAEDKYYGEYSYRNSREVTG